MISHFVLT